MTVSARVVQTSTVTVKVKTPPPHVDLSPLRDNVNAQLVEIYSSQTFAEDVRYLQQNGIPVAVIGRRLGIDRELIYRWMNGQPTKNPAYIMLIRQWAQELRQKIQERDSGGCGVAAFVR
ncbi:MAG: hypothetical protein PHV74_12455 [Dehalococcoidia bacterium]|nr:hypothetical protein [Dehalococcoidia bacterium]